MTTKQTSAAAFDKEATMRLIESASLELLAEHGILAGLNLREVAERARVNRGLVYHYFGSRRALLRSSLRRGFHQANERLRIPADMPRPSRLARDHFRGSLGYLDRWRTVSMLLLDGDPDVKVLPLIANGQRRFTEAKKNGIVAPDADAREFYALLWSIVYGYATLRTAIARDLGLKPATLDHRMEALVERLFTVMDGAS